MHKCNSSCDRRNCRIYRNRVDKNQRASERVSYIKSTLKSLGFIVLLILVVLIFSCKDKRRVSNELESMRVMYDSPQYAEAERKVLKYATEAHLVEQRVSELKTDSILGKNSKEFYEAKQKLVLLNELLRSANKDMDDLENSIKR